ncbi:hypothetical protein HAP47_0036395 [Bradyrhizobium sp. 41S5]|uniref:hypothetical protein n=1 Tax=Bradyrhizobium TaxID=374 RepID=UPI00156A8D99|nr:MULTISPECIES: hypothetical protein [Bradyrhizobium]UFX44428.1 hypothetical protein HAP47_0036395 [Bradyrhizobium sp. 41S5]UPT95840.1 hypothetical protein J4G48_0042820 [Bradyrhizobium barranii subsp. apii]
MAVTNEQIKSVAVLGTKGIELQLSLADKTVQEVLYQIWPFAYCYGVATAVTTASAAPTIIRLAMM